MPSKKTTKVLTRTKTAVLPRLSATNQAKLNAAHEDIAVLERSELPSTRAVSSMLLTLGGLAEPGFLSGGGEHSLLAAAQASNRIQAAVQAQKENDAQPMPSDIRAMLGMCEYFYRVEGDIANTIDVPWEIIGKEIEIAAKDDDRGATDVWNALWRQTDEDTGMPRLDIDEIAEAIYLDTEILGQAFPLEVWSKDEKELSGIAMVEPQSMWVGRSLAPTDLVTDAEDLAVRKLDAQEKSLMYNSFVTDQNQVALPGYRVGIRADRMLPVYAKKRTYKRYAVPHLTRAARNIMHRQILEEYRRGTVEQYLSQLWLFSLGDPSNPAKQVSRSQLNAFNRQMMSAVKNHAGFISTLFPVTSKSLAPETLDNLLGNDSYDNLTFTIMRDLGFFLYILSGEMPGSKASSGDIELGMQLAIERWKYRTKRFLKWAEYISRKHALKSGDTALLKHLPVFTPGSIGIEQFAAIKERIMPLFAAGVLDKTNALKVAGFTYAGVLANKKKEEKDAALFEAPATFNQTAVDSGGKTTTSRTAPQTTGRPSNGNGNGNRMHAAWDDAGDAAAENEVYGRGEAFRDAIDAHYESPDFFEWMKTALGKEMLKAYQDGFLQFGGLNELDVNILDNAPQGVLFQVDRLAAFGRAVENNPSDLLLYRPRALMYASSVNVAYTLGVQQAMKSHGATEWQRVLHPELSVAGPCQACQDDSLVIHSMDEPYMVFHPGDVCSVQAVRYSFAGRARAVIRVPDFVQRVVRHIARVGI